jgi:hypothetical protein
VASSTVASNQAVAGSTAGGGTASGSAVASSATTSASTAAGGTATGPPSTVPGATPAASAASTPAIGPCPASGLKVAVDWGAGQVVMEHFYLPLEFTNVSGRRCTLYGYPGVAVTTGTTPASQVGSQASRTAGGQALRTTDVPATLITLAAGATASATLVIVNVGVYYGACNQVSVSYLEVYPPGQTSAAYVPDTGYTHQACTNPVDQLEITTVEPGGGG